MMDPFSYTEDRTILFLFLFFQLADGKKVYAITIQDPWVQIKNAILNNTLYNCERNDSSTSSVKLFKIHIG